jgi:Uma2 family endonuclease
VQQPVSGGTLSVEEYLRREECSTTCKHEYVNGQVFAMTGSTRRHNIISGNIFSILRDFVKGTPCRAFIGDVKARVEAANCFYYPDAMVSCADDSDDTEVYTDCPVLIVEVLSPSTSQIDRREKLVNYRLIPSLNEYLVIHQRRKCVQLYRKSENGDWSTSKIEAGTVCLLSMPKGELRLEIDEIYDGVRFEKGNVNRVEEPGAEYADEEGDLDW